MARHWLHWVVGGGVSNRPSSAARRRSSTRMSGDADADAPTSAGCMCAVFQLFDLHHHHHPFTFHHHANHFLQDEAISSKGVEAPRNSLELAEPSPKKGVEENLTLPVGIQIKTRISNEGSKSRTEDIPSIDSPSAKTPSLVARLMGLDLLPDQCTSPSNSSAISQRKHMRRNVVLLQTIRSSSNNSRCFSFSDDDIAVGTRSLPETPRISSARRSDSDYHIRSRHSFQNSSKENNTYHHIVKQVKESVGRRVGLNDITNNRSHETMVRRDQNLVLLKPTKKSSHRPSEISTKLGFSDTKKNERRVTRTTSTSSGDDHSDYQRRVILNSMKPKKHQSVIQEHRRVPQHQQKCGKKVNMMIETKKRKKKKATPLLSNEILNISGPILLPVKKDPSPPATKLPQKQMQSQVSDALSSKRNTQTLSSNASRSYTHLHLQPITNKISTVLPDKRNGCATAAAAAEYNTYVQKILKRSGINDNITPVALGKWHTPSHPLDPSIYYYLELFHPSSAAASGVLSRRCNRKLIFQLVDELLAEILRPHLDFKPWVVSPPLPPINNGGDRPGLIDEICRRIGSFPAANCVVLEDIDSLVDGDLCDKWGLKGFFEDGGERLVREIEGEIVEELVRDTVAAMVGVRTAEEREQRQERIMSRGGLFFLT